MFKRDYRDVAAGGALIVIGGLSTLHAATTLSLGTVSHMGPGMFPAALGVILAAFGLIILVPALGRTGNLPEIDIRSLVAVSASILAFALLLRPFGLLPATIAQVIIASQADNKNSLLRLLILAFALAFAAYLVFRVGLGINLSTVSWPW